MFESHVTESVIGKLLDQEVATKSDDLRPELGSYSLHGSSFMTRVLVHTLKYVLLARTYRGLVNTQ